jgi:hypothetical protein
MPNSPIWVFSDDPEIGALQAMIHGMRHMEKKPQLSPAHMKVLAAIRIAVKTLRNQPASIKQIASFCQDEDDLQSIVNDLVAHRYAHEVQPTFGDTMTYKVGAAGGTLLRTMFPSAKKESNAKSRPANSQTKGPDKRAG